MNKSFKPVFIGLGIIIFLNYLQFYLTNSSTFEPQPITQTRWYWILPPLMYGSAFIQLISTYLFKSNYEVTSLDGHSWWTTDIYGSAVLIGLWTSVPFVLYTIYKAVKDIKLAAR